MCDLCRQIFGLVVDLFRSRAALEAEVLVLKQQIIVLRRGKPNRMPFRAVDSFASLSTARRGCFLDHSLNGDDCNFAAFDTTPCQALSEGIDLIVVTAGKCQ